MIKRTKKVVPHIKKYAQDLLKDYKNFHGYSELMNKVCKEDEEFLNLLIKDPINATGGIWNTDVLVMRDMDVPAIGYEEKYSDFAKKQNIVTALYSGGIPEELPFLQKPVPVEESDIEKSWEELSNAMDNLLPKNPLREKTTLWLIRQYCKYEDLPRTYQLTQYCHEVIILFLRRWFKSIEVRYFCKALEFVGEASSETFFKSDVPDSTPIYVLGHGTAQELMSKIKKDDVVFHIGYGERCFEDQVPRLKSVVEHSLSLSPFYAYTEIENGFHREMWQAHEELKAEKYPDLIMTYMSEVEHALDWMVPLAEKLNKTLIR